MIEEIVKAYKCYNTGAKLRCILFGIGIFITFIFIGIMKIAGYTSIAIRGIYVIAIVMVSSITSGSYEFWVRNNSGYGKFIRSIKNSYGKLKIMMIISILEGLAYYLIYFLFLKVIFMILKIKTFYNVYQIFYGIVLGFFLLGVHQILAYCFKNGTKVDIVTSMIICGMIGGGATSKCFEGKNLSNVISSSNTIIITFIVTAVYLSIVYAIVFKNYSYFKTN